MNSPLRISLAMLVATATPVAADWLVLSGGQRIETRGPVDYSGETITFRARNGVLHSVRREMVDLPASYVANGTSAPRALRVIEISGELAWPEPAPWPTPEDGDWITARVVNVIDGDTIRVSYDGRIEVVRIAGIDTPETKHPTKGREYYGPEASAFTRRLLEGQTVRLIRDPRQPQLDRYGRRLAYVETMAGMDIGSQLLRTGHASRYRGANCSRCDVYDDLERRAMAARVGMWGAIGPGTARTQSAAVYLPSAPEGSREYRTPSRPASAGPVRVKSYTRADGTVVPAHSRSRPRR